VWVRWTHIQSRGCCRSEERSKN